MEVQAGKSYFREKIITPVSGFLKEGISPKQLAMAFSIGIVVGIIPLLGCTTLICFALAFILRLNMAALQLTNYLIFPLQLLLFIPFFQAGGYLFSPLDIPLSAGQVSEMMSTDIMGAIRQLWFANLQALLVWLLLAIPSYFILYFTLLHILKKAGAAIETKKSE